MAIIGFIFCCLVLGQLTLIGLLMLTLCTGPFTIGGAVQSWGVRVISVIAPFVLGYLWYKLFTEYAPFELIWK